MAASLKRVAVFSNVQEHGEIRIIHFTFILILFLLCLFWSYPLFQCVYKSSTLFLYFYLLVLLYILPSYIDIHIWDTTNNVRCGHNCLTRGFWEISTKEIIFSKVSDLSFSSIYFWSDLTRDSNTKFTDTSREPSFKNHWNFKKVIIVLGGHFMPI